MNTLDPCWAETQIPITTICNGDYHCPLKIEIFDFDSSGKHTFMGESYTSVHTWLTERLLFLDIIEPEKQKRDRSYVNSGKLKIFFANIVHLPLFADVSPLFFLTLCFHCLCENLTLHVISLSPQDVKWILL